MVYIAWDPNLGTLFCRNYELSTKLKEVGKELLLYGVGANALAQLKKQYINFGNATIHLMILHL